MLDGWEGVVGGGEPAGMEPLQAFQEMTTLPLTPWDSVVLPLALGLTQMWSLPWPWDLPSLWSLGDAEKEGPWGREFPMFMGVSSLHLPINTGLSSPLFLSRGVWSSFANYHLKHSQHLHKQVGTGENRGQCPAFGSLIALPLLCPRPTSGPARCGSVAWVRLGVCVPGRPAPSRDGQVLRHTCE